MISKNQTWYVESEIFYPAKDQLAMKLICTYENHPFLSEPILGDLSAESFSSEIEENGIITDGNITEFLRNVNTLLQAFIQRAYDEELTDEMIKQIKKVIDDKAGEGKCWIKFKSFERITPPENYERAVPYNAGLLFQNTEGSDRQPIPSNEYLRSVIGLATNYQVQAEESGNELLRRKAFHGFNNLMHRVGTDLSNTELGKDSLNYFLMPVTDPFDVMELFDTSVDRNYGTLWSANRLCRRGDVVLFYFAKKSEKRLAELNFVDGTTKDFFRELPASIFAAARVLNDTTQTSKDIFAWNYRVFIGNVIIFSNPIAKDDIKDEKGENLSSKILQGGLMQPKSLYNGDQFLKHLKKIIFKRQPELQKTYLKYEPSWPDNIPAIEDPEWAEKMGRVDARSFCDEASVRRHFIDALLRLAKPSHVGIQDEYYTDPVKKIRVDYLLFDDKTKLPVEAKYDINIEKFNVARVQDYLKIATNKTGLLIDLNGVYIVEAGDNHPKTFFLRKGMGNPELSKMKRWLSKYFGR